MADWLAYGLEDALAETPEFGVVRKHRTYSGLLRYESRSDADWAQVARETIAAEKPQFIVMMLGINDRQSIRERVVTPPARGAVPRGNVPAAHTTQPQAQDPEKPHDTENPDQSSSAAPEPAPRSRVAGTHEFRSEKWVELYSKRIDDTIAALKSRGVPVFWVGLPALRGQRSTSEMVYLNELYRVRAEKAGIVFIDVWDGFVDESGRFALQGPDLEGQIRRLRTSDGVHFTKAGARKLAHYVEREIKRAALRGPAMVALPTSEPQPQAPSAKPGGPTARPLSGPVMPLTAAANTDENGLLGGTNTRPVTDHVTVSRVLVKGEAVQSPAGRGDDFAWPRRGVAPFGTDPVVATTTLPLPVMQPPAPKTVLAPQADAPAATVAAAPRRSSQAPRHQSQQQQQRQAPRPFFFPFFR
jgi:lysophospholipase L1-like esterase